MPFGNEQTDAAHFRKMEEIYSEWIKPTVESVSFSIQGSVDNTLTCHRADKNDAPGDILEHIIESLVTADIVIADLTGRNANVFYELGIRHAVSNATILISEGIDDIPFDVRSLRAIVYQYTPPGMLKLQRELRRSVASIVSQPDRIDNPVRKLLYDREIMTLLERKAPPGFDAVRTVLEEVAQLKQGLRSLRSLVAGITSSTQGVAVSGFTMDLRSFEGVWESEEDSCVCMKVVNNELRVAYCYAGSDRLTAHYYNCHLLGTALFARFAWFGSEVRGFIILQYTSKDLLSGGWYFADDVPSEVASAFPSGLCLDLPNMQRSSLTRVQGADYPHWAVGYFQLCEGGQGVGSR
jgi:hypothetical protein